LIDSLKVIASNCPSTPGIYKFFHRKKIIYIGKANNLRKRVSSYFTNSIKDRKTEKIKNLTDHIETFSTNNEAEALLLEQSLIKENRPKFNILLRDDKSYPYIYFSMDHHAPSITLKRTKKAIDHNYYGPYTNSSFARNEIKTIQKIFKIRNCSDSIFSNRSRPCIEYQMKKCSAPCVDYISEEDYLSDIKSAQDYLCHSKNQTKLILIKRMKDHARELEFEEADRLKQKLESIEKLQDQLKPETKSMDLDIFAIEHFANKTGASILCIREGSVRTTKTHFFHTDYSNNEQQILETVLFNFYVSDHQIPKKILILSQKINLKVIKDAIEIYFNKSLSILKTINKHNRRLSNLAKLNAKQCIQNKMQASAFYKESILELAKLLRIKSKSILLEALDISHHSGSNPKGSIISLSKNGFKRSNYRIYNIPNELAGNDVASLGYMIDKRIQSNRKYPDIILIDGGKHQLNFGHKALKKYSQNIHVLAIVKGQGRIRATETILSKNGILEVDKNSQIFLLLQKARDEAHRFAIRANRRAQAKATKKSALDQIMGIGIRRKNLLLKHFGSIMRIKEANIEDLSAVKGINHSLAIRIKEGLN